MALGEPRHPWPGETWPSTPDTCQCERCPHCGKVKTPVAKPWTVAVSGQVYTPKPGDVGTWTING